MHSHHPSYCRVLALASAVVLGVPLPARAQQSCTLICAPSLDFEVAGIKSHVFGAPTVRNDSTGATHTLASKTNLELEFYVAAPTHWHWLYGYVDASWLPNASTSTNPYTQYTASEVGGIDANHVNLGFGLYAAVVPTSATHGYALFELYGGDLFSPAAQPGDQSAYTHKLDVGTSLVLYPFAGADTASFVSRTGLYVYGVLDYVATGLPKKGDDIPQGVHTFLTDARPAVLIWGVGMPIAPLFSK